ncbi:MAG: DUF542 domain-containing protein [Venatoribacter sp.]
MDLLQRSLSEIATTISGAPSVLREYHLDFCEKGRMTLSQAVAANALNEQEILEKLSVLNANQDVTNWTKLEPTKLIAYILERYHAPHRKQLPELISLASKVERTHKAHADCPTGLSELLRDLYHELNSHMMKEEQILFPMLGGGIYPSGPINVMQDEHDGHMDTIEAIYKLTNNLTLPNNGSCNSWKNLYKGLHIFVDDLMQHIALENYFLFEQPQEN